jgi:ABC-type antimicrobial peptide transport system permease subunit
VLAALGIAIGTAAIVAVLGVSQSSKADLLARLDKLGTNLLTVEPGTDFLSDRPAQLPARSLSVIATIPPVEHVSATITTAATVRRTDKIPAYLTGAISVQGADLRLLDTLGGRVATGTWLNPATDRYPAVVLGAQAGEVLGIDRVDRPLAVWISGRWFTVVGILAPVALAPEIDRSALVGMPAARRLLGADVHPSEIYVRASPDQTLAVRGVLARTTDPEHPEQVNVARPSDALAARVAAKGAYNSLLLALGAIALLVGGVGIANVMVMSVFERRGEIGLRRALGATRRHIALQFSAEALLLSALGGAAGVAAGAATTAASATHRHWSISIPPSVVAGGLLAAISVGTIAGLYPALRAARLAPTEALRSA